jgi:hypothetical protein
LTSLQKPRRLPSFPVFRCAAGQEIAMSLADTRFDQMFPVLTPVQVETARRFASGNRAA